MDHALEIHHIDVGGGDATVILVKDEAEKILTKILIDAGAAGGGSQSLTAYINAYLEPTIPFDYIIASHYHDDHIKGFDEGKISFTHYVDIGGYKVADDAPPLSANGSGFGKQPAYFMDYVQRIKANITANKAQRLGIPFISKDKSGTLGPLEIKLGRDANGATLTCYCAGGVLANGTNVLADQKIIKGRAFDPNDLSLAFILEWGTFRYFTAGDLSGDPALASYYDMEGKLVPYLQAQGKLPLPITAMKVTHHGSERSSYFSAVTKTGFLDALKATTLIISCNIAKKVPHPNFLDRVYNYASANNASILFVNDLNYTASDPEYAGTAKIINYPAFACNAVINTDNSISNDAKAIVLRRLFDGTVEKPVKEGKDNSYAKKDADNNAYSILIRSGKFVRTGGTLSRPDQLQIEFRFLKTYYDEVSNGFTAHAQAITKWLKQDQDQKESVGRDYLSLNLPELIKVIPTPFVFDDTLETKLYEKMQSLFNSSFQLETIKDGTYYTVNNASFSKLSLEEKQTMCKLTTQNKYQALMIFTVANRIFPANTNNAYNRYCNDPTNFWNGAGEPYAVAGEGRAATEAGAVKGKRKRE